MFLSEETAAVIFTLFYAEIIEDLSLRKMTWRRAMNIVIWINSIIVLSFRKIEFREKGLLE